MSLLSIVTCVSSLCAPAVCAAQEASADLGRHVAIVSGCNDCHTPGYPQSGGVLDPKLALTGDTVGFRGPWGTTYPANLRLVVAAMSEADWVAHARTLETRPPMPWFNLHEMTETELRSFYLYVKSLGEPGQAAPAYVPPGQEPTTPFIVFAPPTMPARQVAN
ncbi:cytochrome C [Aureimonas glaciei]|nr:cytochrome C [Aureimonas glaciei]